MNKSTDTKEKILDIANKLFVSHGYDNVSIQDICEKAELTKTTFYYYFASKEELLCRDLTPPEVAPYDILRHIFSADSYWKQLWLMSDHTLSELSAKGPDLLSQVIKINLAHNCQTFPSLSNDLLNIAVPLIKKAQEAGEIRNHSDAFALVRTGWLLILAHCTDWCINNGSYDIKQAHLSSLETLFDVDEKFRFSLEDISREMADIHKKS